MTLGATTSLAVTDLRGLARFLAGVDANAWSSADVTGLLNQYLHTFQIWITEFYPAFRFTGATADTSLVAGTSNYAFPTDYVQIDRIEISYNANENSWSQARVYDLRSVPDSIRNLEDTGDRLASVANPIVYVLNNRLYLRITPLNAVTNGLRVWYSSIQTELSGTTDEPVFPEHFHRGLAIGAAHDFAIAKGLPNAGQLESELVKLKTDMQKFFLRQIQTENIKLRPRIHHYV